MTAGRVIVDGMRFAGTCALALSMAACAPWPEPPIDATGETASTAGEVGETGDEPATTFGPSPTPTTGGGSSPTDTSGSESGPQDPPDDSSGGLDTGEPSPPGPDPVVSELFDFIAMDLGDVDGDGHIDLVTSGTGAPPRVNFYPGAGDGRFAGEAAVVSELYTFSEFVLGDVTGDGRSDVIARGAGQPPRVTVYAADAGGAFKELSTTELPNFVQIHAVDLDGDGRADLLTGSGEGPPPRVQGWAGGPGGIAGTPSFTLETFNYNSLRGGDIDGDGHADIVTAGTGAPPRLNVYRGDGVGGFAEAEVIDLSTFSRFDVGDLDGDGRGDVVTDVPGNAWRFQLYRSTPGRWAAPLVIDGFNFVGFELGDVDGDGRADIVARPTGAPPRVEVYLGPL